ncbi:MAG: DNA polymerase I [Lachnospiraceae bacterium]
MSEKIVLIDGHSIINRAFYGVPDLTNRDGLHTNGIYGFLNILFKIVEEEKPDYLTVAFDVKHPTFRHEMYAEYKGTRKGMPQELHEQVPVLKELLHAMGIKIMELPGFEADDLLGTVARRSEAKGMEALIVSGDRDLLQMASDHIRICIPKTKRGTTEYENYHTKDVQEKYGLLPYQIIELKALMGDSSDNIPGVPGIGEKTATAILQAYETVENAHAHLDEIKPKRARENLEAHYDMALMSRRLATIETDAPYEYHWEEAKIGNFYTKEAYEICKKLELKKILAKFDMSAEEMGPEQKTVQISELTEAEDVFEKAAAASKTALSLKYANKKLVSVLLVFDNSVYEILTEGFLTESYLIDKAKQVLQTGQKLIVSGLKELLKVLKIEERPQIHDIDLMNYLINPVTAVKPGEIDPLSAWQSFDEAESKLKELGMWELYTELELPLVYTLSRMEQAGIIMRADLLKEYGENLAVKIRELEERIYEQAGERFNINSPKQLGVILFEKLQLPGSKKTKTGYSTSADVLEKLAPKQPIIRDILEYRTLSKLKSTYADGLLTCLAEDGRVHSTFQQTVTATGRLSSTDPNLQNIPIRMELGREIRKVFVPQEGYVFVDADYSQIELRLLAHMSGDEVLIKAYNEAQDIHRLTASQVFHVPFEEVTDLQRRNAKAVNFGIVYGISSYGLSEDLSISPKEAKQYIDHYFETYPKIKEFLDNTVAKAKEEGCVRTLYNRRRPVPELASSNFMQRSFGERIAMNSPIQGTAADIMKIAMIRVDRRLRGMKSRLLLQVHDELLIETAAEEVEEVIKILEEEMTGAADLDVTLEIDVHEGKSWYEAK